MTSTIVLLAIAGVIAILAITIYNRLVRLRNGVRSSWSDIDVQLKKRYDLVPSLVETVKAYAKHESGVFEKVTQARSQAMQATSPSEQGKQENIFKETIKSLFAVAEAYPELKANENFISLQKEFGDLEDGIENARRYYNAITRDYNTAREVFPAVLLAGMFGFKEEEYFQLESPEVERKPIKPDFS